MELLNDELVKVVVKQLEGEKAVAEKQIKKQENLTETLNGIIEAANQLKENKKLGEVIAQKRKILYGIEKKIAERERDGQNQETAIKNDTKSLKDVYSEAKKEFDEKEKKEKTERVYKEAGERRQSDEKIKGYKKQEAEAKANKEKAVTECSQVEGRRKALKEELIANL